MRGVAIVQVCNMSGGATISPKRERAAASGSVYTGFSSSNAAAQCLIIGWLTGSGPFVVLPPSLMGFPTNAWSRSSSVASTIAAIFSFRCEERDRAT